MEPFGLFASELQMLTDSHDNLHCHVRYSEPSAQDKAKGGFDSTGFLDRALLDQLVGERRAEYYFCGPVPMSLKPCMACCRKKVWTMRISITSSSVRLEGLAA